MRQKLSGQYDLGHNPEVIRIKVPSWIPRQTSVLSGQRTLSRDAGCPYGGSIDVAW